MDLWSVQVKSPNPTPLFPRSCFIERSARNFHRTGSFQLESGTCRFLYELGVANRPFCSSCCSRSSSVAVKAMSKRNSGNSSSSSSSSGNGDQSSPDGDAFKGHDPKGNKSSDGISPKSHHNVNLDWREFRATLFAREQVEAAEPGFHVHDGDKLNSKTLGVKWAHPISLPETGSVLVATEKLEKSHTFKRTVILLLKGGTENHQENPFGVVINCPLHKQIKHTKFDLVTSCADSAMYFGGPLEANMFLIRTGENRNIGGFEEVIPGLSFGYWRSLKEAMGLVKKGVLKPQDFRFFVGYAGWKPEQLRQELVNNIWHVAACSANIIFGETHDSSEGLWEEILQLMGGEYSELSRKPKQDM